MKTLLDACSLAFSYGRREVFRDISLALEPGCIVALLGPNGSGKSTLLRVLAGLLEPSAGEVTLSGRPLAEMTRREIACGLACVPQQTASVFAYTALEVVLMAREARHAFPGSVDEADHTVARTALESVGAAHLTQRIFQELSGGERQLVILARALAQEAPLLLMDEPATSLDYGNQIRLLDLVSSLASTLGKSVLMTTHSPEHARACAHEVLLLKGGRITDRGRPCCVLKDARLAALYDLTPERLAAYRESAQSRKVPPAEAAAPIRK